MLTILRALLAGTGSRPLVCVGLALTLGRLGVAMGGVCLGSFDVKGDSRQFEVQNFHRVSDKLNVSLSAVLRNTPLFSRTALASPSV